MSYNRVVQLERKLRKVGGSVMLPLPPETLAEAGLRSGDVVRLSSRAGRIEVTPTEGPDMLEVAAFAARFASRYREALTRLAL